MLTVIRGIEDLSDAELAALAGGPTWHETLRQFFDCHVVTVESQQNCSALPALFWCAIAALNWRGSHK
jgi:hypothetical protein